MRSILITAFISLLSFTGVHSSIADFDCFERADKGVGRAFIESYAWNPRNRTCTEFIYGGVDGNRNQFPTREACLKSCYDAVLRKQLNFDSTRRYSAINRLFEVFQVALHIEAVDDGYFKLILQPSGKLLSIAEKNNEFFVEAQESNGNLLQHWDIVPTGEENYYRIKSRDYAFKEIDHLFLQVVDDGDMSIAVARRDNTYPGQQWKLV